MRSHFPKLFLALFLFFQLTACTQKAANITKRYLEENASPPPYYLSEDEVATRVPQEVYPFLNSIVKEGVFEGAESGKIAYKLYQQDQAKATLLVLHGWTESSHQFSEFIYYLLKDGYNVFTYDHRSHGKSQRFGIHPDQTHIEKFDDYVVDLKIFIEKIAQPNLKTSKLFLYAHSMGALIATRYMETYPHPFHAAILSTPMTEMANGPYPAWFVETIINVGVFLGKARDWCPGQGPFVYDYNPEWRSTSSLARHNFNYDQKKLDPDLRSWGASFNWYYEGYQAARKAIDPSSAKNITIPVLIFQSGGDNVLGYKSADSLAQSLPKSDVIFVPKGRHLLYMETDSILKPYLKEVLGFYQRNL